MVTARLPCPDSFGSGFSIILRDGKEWAGRVFLSAPFFFAPGGLAATRGPAHLPAVNSAPAVHADIRYARTLPAAWYRNESLFQRVLERAFAPSWQFLAHDRDPPGRRWTPLTVLPGSLDEPILLVRDGEARRAYANVCTHRGHLVAEAPSDRPVLRCRYHGRGFDDRGRVVAAPGFEEAPDFPCAEDHLPGRPVGTWGGLLFTRLEPDAEHPGGTTAGRPGLGRPELADWLAPLACRLPEGFAGRLRPAPERDADYDVPAHWALYVDNYLEGFHIPFVHPALNRALDWAAYETELFEGGSLQIGLAAEGEPAFPAPGTGPDAGKRVAGYYAHFFPNLMLNAYPWGISLNLVEPLGSGRCRVRFRSFVADPSALAEGMDLDEVQREDEEVVRSVQRGIRSRAYRDGRFSPTQERAVHHFHRQLAALSGEG